jgi:hypothetical protein
MKILSFDGSTNYKIVRDPEQNNLFNLFQKNVMVVPNITLSTYIVPREYEMRLDRISNQIYGTPDYVEELMILNNIISPYSVKEGQYIYYIDLNNMGLLYTRDEMSDEAEKVRQALIKSSQSTNNKSINTDNKNLPSTINQPGLKQIKVSKDFRVDIINSFE